MKEREEVNPLIKYSYLKALYSKSDVKTKKSIQSKEKVPTSRKNFSFFTSNPQKEEGKGRKSKQSLRANKEAGRKIRFLEPGFTSHHDIFSIILQISRRDMVSGEDYDW